MDKDKVDWTVLWFSAKMREKLYLPKNIAKEDWNKMPTYQLLNRLDDEHGELSEEIEGFDRPRYEAIISECCDVANFAMMIADNTNKARQRANLETKDAILREAGPEKPVPRETQGDILSESPISQVYRDSKP